MPELEVAEDDDGDGRGPSLCVVCEWDVLGGERAVVECGGDSGLVLELDVPPCPGSGRESAVVNCT